MIILDSVSKKLCIYLAGAKATVDATWVVAYADTDGISFVEAGNDGSTNGVTKVDMVAAPVAGHRRIIKSLSIFNNDTENITYYIAVYNGTVYQIIDAKVLTPDSSQLYGMENVNIINQGLNTTDSPTFAGLTDSGLTASLPIVTDSNKKLASLAYTGVASFRKNLGLETSDSPTFTAIDTGNLTSLVPVISTAGGFSPTAAQCKGQLHLITATGTITLPAVSADLIGSVLTVYSTTAAAIHVDPNNADRIILDGVALDDGDKITSASGGGDYVTLICDSADGWIVIGRSGTWTDGG